MRYRVAATVVIAMELIRILSAQPTSDGERVHIKAAIHRDAWYEDAFGQNPTPFYRNPFIGTPQRPPYPWKPGADVFSGFDVIGNPTPYSFDLALDITKYPAVLSAAGNVPVNIPSAVDKPRVPLQAATASTGGTIAPGTYFIAISWNGAKGPISEFVTAAVPAGTSTNKVTVSGIVWPSSSAPSAAVFAGVDVLHMEELAGASWSALSSDSHSNPTSIEITDVTGNGNGMPDAAAQTFIMRQTPIAHGGLWGAVVSAFSRGATYDVLTFSGASFTVNQWAGYTLSLYYRAASDGLQYPLSLTVASNTATTISIANASGHVPQFAAGDVVVMRAAASHLGTGDTVGDDNFINCYAPSGLSTGGEEIGRLIRVIYGTGAGQSRTVKSNTSKVYTVTEPFSPALDSSSVWIVTEPNSYPEAQSKVIVNDGTGASYGVVNSSPATNTAAQSLLVEVATADANGNHFDMRYQPLREVFIPAQTGLKPVYDIAISGGSAQIDLTNGTVQRIALPNDGSLVSILKPTFTGGFIHSGMEVTIYYDTPSSGTFQTPSHATGMGGFASDTNNGYTTTQVLSVRDKVTYKYQPESVWSIESIRSGCAQS